MLSSISPCIPSILSGPHFFHHVANLRIDHVFLPITYSHLSEDFLGLFNVRLDFKSFGSIIWVSIFCHIIYHVFVGDVKVLKASVKLWVFLEISNHYPLGTRRVLLYLLSRFVL